MTNVRLSVAMCTYNGADFLPAQLESIISQSRQPDDMVICDDGSSDETRTLLQNFALHAPFPVSLNLNEQNLGSIKNFEKAIGLCTGDIIALSDQDDVWRNDKLRLIDESFRKFPKAGVVFSDAEVVDDNLQPLNRRMWEAVSFDEHKRKLVRQGRALEVLINGWTVTGATMAFQSQFVQLALPIPAGIPMIHDGWIAVAIAAVADVVMIEEPLIKYRQHGRQQIGAPTRIEETRSRALEALRRRSNSAGLQQILEALRDRLLVHANEYDTRRSLSFIGNYSYHLKARASLPQRRLNRVPGILRELLSLRYHEYANGFKSAVKDLVSKFNADQLEQH